jgi:hypothetical protein
MRSALPPDDSRMAVNSADAVSAPLHSLEQLGPPSALTSEPLGNHDCHIGRNKLNEFRASRNLQHGVKFVSPS